VDLLSQAKEFIARKASKLAMVALPLAVLAVTVPARAGAILNPNGTDTCLSEPASGGSCTIVATATGANSNLNQIQMSGFVTAFGVNGDFVANILNSGSGTADGGSLAAGSVPVNWLFNIGSNTGTVNWDVGFALFLGNQTVDLFSMSGSSSGGQVAGSGMINVPIAAAVDGYSISLDTSSLSGYTLNVPADATLVINSSNTSTPEPASLLLMAAGGGAMLLLKKRKQQA
jgi:hypothetical protein